MFSKELKKMRVYPNNDGRKVSLVNTDKANTANEHTQ